MLLPFVHITTKLIGIHLRPIGVRDNDCTIWTAQWAPHNIWTGIRCRGVLDNDRKTFLFAKLEGRVCENVVDGIVDTVGGGIADGVFVDQNPLLDGRNVFDHRHSGTGNVVVVRDIVDNGTPSLEISRSLMCKLLAVLGIALVRVESDELAFILPGQLCQHTGKLEATP